MSPWLEHVRLVLFVVAVLASAFGGWTVRGWKEAAEQRSKEELVQKAVDAFHQSEGRAAAQLEDRLATLQGTRTVVEKQVEKVVDRPVYRNVCLDLDGLRIVETARAGKVDPAKPAASVP